ncbi:hypothetical protein CHKEEEPN_4186 [Methylorubrum podarium]|nr:hypothetical protein CHKEEEPN_4186 [Methylorubrum podarium]
MLAADAELEPVAGGAAALGADLHEFAHALLIDRHERIDREDALLGVGPEEGGGVVAGNAERRLGQIVGAEGEELRGLGDLAGLERRPRQLDHRADLVFKLRPRLLRHGLGHGVDPGLDDVELHPREDERHHHLRRHRGAGVLGGLHRRLEDRAGLHLGDLGEGDGEPAAAEAEHRVVLGEFADAVADLVLRDAGRGLDLADLLVGMRQELVQRRVEQADCDG